jgi:hypothetical protein
MPEEAQTARTYIGEMAEIGTVATLRAKRGEIIGSIAQCKKRPAHAGAELSLPTLASPCSKS